MASVLINQYGGWFCHTSGIGIEEAKEIAGEFIADGGQASACESDEEAGKFVKRLGNCSDRPLPFIVQ